MSRLQRIVSRLAVGALALALSLGTAPAANSLRSNPVYGKMLRWGAGIRTSVADIEVHTHMRSFPPASFTFHGHSYYEAPDKQAVVFDDVPSLMRGLVKDSPTIEPVPVWPEYYDGTVAGDDGTTTTFHLVPKDSQSKVASADVDVDDTTGLVARYTFTNQNGSTVDTEQTYEPLGRRQVVASQIGHARGHGYNAEVTTTFSNYRFNVPLSDDVFEPQ
ncbi:MAG: LolA family protein [Vulcanimicrobiaceae bacterium]